MPSLTVAGTYNARSVSAATWLIRTASLDTLTPAGVDDLHALGVTTIVDLRDELERTRPVHDFDVHAFDVVSVPLYRRIDGPPVIGRLEEVYEFLLTERQRELTTAVTAVARAPGSAVVHCTAGKDRTGLVVALCLLVSGASREAVIDDYVLSGSEVLTNRESIVAELLADYDLGDASYREATRLHLESPRKAIGHALEVIERFGGAESYLLGGGALHDDLEELRRKSQP